MWSWPWTALNGLAALEAISPELFKRVCSVGSSFEGTVLHMPNGGYKLKIQPRWHKLAHVSALTKLPQHRQSPKYDLVHPASA